MKKIPPKILECTLRDGSYAIDFQFSADETRKISSSLDSLSFPYIEVGHGIGLGASKKGYGLAKASDKEYMHAASQSIKNNKWGMFCILAIAELSDIELAAEYQMDFIRIGFDIENLKKAYAFIELAKKNNIYVFVNVMKSYKMLCNNRLINKLRY